MLEYEILFDDFKKEDTARIKLTCDKWNGIIYHYNTVSFLEEHDGDGILKFEYDIVESPNDIDTATLTKEDHEQFETLLGDILVEIISEATDSENRTDDPNQFNL